MLGKSAATLAFLWLVLLPLPARAEHEIYYRYTVIGYIKDGSGKVRPGLEVTLTREKTGFSYLDETDASGFYVIVARLGDESVGERLLLRAAGHSLAIAARFDPADHAHERGTRVDFVGGTPIETQAAFSATLERFLRP